MVAWLEVFSQDNNAKLLKNLSEIWWKWLKIKIEEKHDKNAVLAKLKIGS